MRSIVLAIALATGFVISDAASAESFSISFRWCSGSPAFEMRDVPKGTRRIDFHMIDFQASDYQHGGGQIIYSGQKSVPCGSFTGNNYNSPSPPRGSHTYQWTAKALGGDGSVLATATAERKFPE